MQSNFDIARQMILDTFEERKFTKRGVEQALRLCERAGGIFVFKGLLIAWFWYKPELGELVAKMNFDVLERLRLGGPLLHIVAWISPTASYRPVREFIHKLNPWGVTCHRWNRRTGDFRFAAQRNRRWIRGSGEDQHKGSH